MKATTLDELYFQGLRFEQPIKIKGCTLLFVGITTDTRLETVKYRNGEIRHNTSITYNVYVFKTKEGQYKVYPYNTIAQIV